MTSAPPTRLVLEEVNSARLAASALARQGRGKKPESTGARRSGQFFCHTKGLLRCHRKLSWEELAVELSVGGRFAVDASNVVVFSATGVYKERRSLASPAR